MDFGKTPEGAPVDLYVLTNGKMTAKVMTYGAILTELQVPDRNGKLADVVLGFDSLDGYLAGHPHFGATTGRVANRIAKGRFTLDGTEYKLAVNNGPNSLHGGLKGFDKKVWKAEDASGSGRLGGQNDVHQSRRRGRLSRQPLRQRDLYRHARQRAQDRLHLRRPTRRPRSTSPTTAILTSPGQHPVRSLIMSCCWLPTSTPPPMTR